jgi:SSS family transporter
MLIASVLLYLAITIGIGLWAASRVHNAKDYLVAGRSLPLYMNMATVFATWFGAETVLSVSATFAKDGLHGVPADPFGASFALVFVALFFAKAFYRMDLLTIGDFYHKRYGKLVEVLTSLAITASYLGWTSAQLTALGLVFHVLSGGALSLNQCIALGAFVVILYTMFGGMWSVALTDLFQTVIIVIGLLVIAWLIGDLAGGPATVIARAHADGKFDFWPAGGLTEWLPFVAAWMTMALGSIPQQDVFQRVTSAKDERTAVRGTLLGGAAYFIFAFVPMFIAYAAVVIDPKFTDLFASEDGREVQRILPDLILNRMPGWAQVVFFGALLSAILSTASGALLAPTALFTENVLRPFMPRVSDRRFLVMLRTVLVLFSCAALLFALNSRSTMYEMVQNAYKVTLVGALVPLAAGIFWKRASVQGALLSIFSGLVVWLGCETNFADALVPPQINGLLAALVGMLIGSLAPQLVPDHRGSASPAP